MYASNVRFLSDLYYCALRITRNDNGLYTLNLKPQTNATALVAVSVETWHKRLGHLGEQHLSKLIASDALDGLEILRQSASHVPCLKYAIQLIRLANSNLSAETKL